MKLPKPVETTLSHRQFETWIKRQGLKQIGCGVYSRVYARPDGPLVYKVGQVRSTRSYHNDAYLDFLAHIKTDNPLFPKVKDIVIYQSDHGNYYCVVLERLLRFNSVKQAKRTQYLKDLELSSIYDLEEWGQPKFKNKSVISAVKVLKRVWKRHCSDIHDGNIMWRKTKTGHEMVITDPAC